MKDSDLMPFGKYKGEKLGDVPAEYLLWVFDNVNRPGEMFQSVRQYIKDNLKALEKEIKND